MHAECAWKGLFQILKQYSTCYQSYSDTGCSGRRKVNTKWNTQSHLVKHLRTTFASLVLNFPLIFSTISSPAPSYVKRSFGASGVNKTMNTLQGKKKLRLITINGRETEWQKRGWVLLNHCTLLTYVINNSGHTQPVPLVLFISWKAKQNLLGSQAMSLWAQVPWVMGQSVHHYKLVQWPWFQHLMWT